MTDRIEFPQSHCLVGVSSGDITPPVGMYHRMWGAARQDTSTGVHRPLRVTTLLTAPLIADDIRTDAVVFVGLDHCLLGPEELDAILKRAATLSGVKPDQIIVLFSHTHATGLLSSDRISLPGGDLIPGYFDDLAKQIGSSIVAAIESAEPAVIMYGTGACSLAAHRDYFDASSGRFVVGFNPDRSADPTVLAARIHSQADHRLLATMVNYACHPTTLAWDNSLISPDYVGAMREIIEEATGVPCLFLQGASGDIGPRDGFVGDTEVADRNGRQLGYAVLSTLESVPNPGRSYRYAGAVESGATIGVWEWVDSGEERQRSTSVWTAHEVALPLRYRSDLPDRETLLSEQARWTEELSSREQTGDSNSIAEARTSLERITRRLFMIGGLPDGPTYPYPIRIWRLGDAIWIALNGEHYNILQTRLRERFPDTPIIVGTLANGSAVWYLPDQDSYGKGLYQERVSILERGSLERLIQSLGDDIERLQRGTLS